MDSFGHCKYIPQDENFTNQIAISLAQVIIVVLIVIILCALKILCVGRRRDPNKSMSWKLFHKDFLQFEVFFLCL